jgi:hypothetical protein
VLGLHGLPGRLDLLLQARRKCLCLNPATDLVTGAFQSIDIFHIKIYESGLDAFPKRQPFVSSLLQKVSVSLRCRGKTAGDAHTQRAEIFDHFA